MINLHPLSVWGETVGKVYMKKTEKKELAKDLLIDALSVAYYRLENSEYSHISAEDQEEIIRYMNQYGESMAKRIGRRYFTQ